MTDTDPTPAASKPNGRKKQNATATEQLPEGPASTTVVAPAPAPAAPARTGVGRGILIGAIAASLVGGLAIGGGAGALIATAAGHHRPDFSQAGQQGPFGQGGPQQGGQQGPGQGFGQGGPQGGMPGFPGQQTQPGQNQPGQTQPGQIPPQPGQTQQGQDYGSQTQQDGTDSGDGSN